jgi:CMP-N,N'-diacetyllegionaminic acid synthase
MKFVALIPARAGSKGIPEKNIRLLDGVPLIVHTIREAVTAIGKERVFVTTDSPDIAEVAKNAGAQVPFLRPKELSGDEATAYGVVEHFLDWTHDNAPSSGAIAYLQPTSPLRSAAAISNACKLFEQGDADSLVSVIPVPHQFSPSSLMQANGDWLTPIDSYTSAPLRRQDKPAFFARNGPAILITRPETLAAHGNLYGEKILKFEMTHEESVDIDSQQDLEYAAWLLVRREV